MNTTTILPVGETIKSAWGKIYGAKASIWAAVIVSQVIVFVLMMVCGVVSKAIPAFGIVLMAVSGLIFLLLQMGIYYIGIIRAKNLPVNYKLMYYPFTTPMTLNIIGLLIIEGVILLIPVAIAMLGTLLANQGSALLSMLAAIIYLASAFVSVYLVLSMLLGLGYVLSQQLNPIAAIKRSFEVTQAHLIELFGIYIVFIVIYFLLSIPFGIGLIWGIPFAFVLYGEIFERLTSNTIVIKENITTHNAPKI